MTVWPQSLFFLLLPAITSAQSRPQLLLNQFVTLEAGSSSPHSFGIPHADSALSISVALCSSTSSVPRFFVTNTSDSNDQADPGPSGGDNNFEIHISYGQGIWSGVFPNGGIVAVDPNGSSEVSLQIGVSDSGSFIFNPISLYLIRNSPNSSDFGSTIGSTISSSSITASLSAA